VHPAIQFLAGQPRLNFWLGPGCAAGTSGFSEADALRELRRTNPRVKQQATLEETFASIPAEARASFRHAAFNGMNWTYLSIAATVAQDRAGALVMRGVDDVLPRLLASRDIVPPLFDELDKVSGPAAPEESSAALFSLPVLRDPQRWADSIGRLGGNVWVVAGVSKSPDAEAAVIRQLAGASVTVYWIPLWDEPGPRDASIQSIPGFDPDSFFFALAHAMTGFLPTGLGATEVGDAEALGHAMQGALSAEAQALRNSAHEVLLSASTLLDNLNLLDDDTYRARMREFHAAELKKRRLAPRRAGAGGIELFHKARNVGGKRADVLLELAEEEQQMRVPDDGLAFRAVLEAVQEMRILHARALLRRSAEAQSFYQRAHRLLRSLPPQEPRAWQAAVDAAGVLSDWAATREPAEAGALVREAIDLTERALTGGALKAYEEKPLWTTRITIFRKHALRLEGELASGFLNEAKQASERLRLLKDEFMYQYMLAIIGFDEARKNPSREAEQVEAAHAHFQNALELKAESRGLLQLDWGTALATLGGERQGAEADRYFAEAFTRFASVASDDKAFTPVQNNWSAFLLVQARRKTGEQKERLLEESWTHASTAEQREPTLAAYNLACIAAERSDWDTMSKWLRISARGPRFPAPSHTDTVTSFDPIRQEQWFQDLLRELYP
jgi:hypothetical protein